MLYLKSISPSPSWSKALINSSICKADNGILASCKKYEIVLLQRNSLVCLSVFSNSAFSNSTSFYSRKAFQLRACQHIFEQVVKRVLPKFCNKRVKVNRQTRLKTSPSCKLRMRALMKLQQLSCAMEIEVLCRSSGVLPSVREQTHPQTLLKFLMRNRHRTILVESGE